MKVCTKCKDNKKLSEFYVNKKAKDGRHSHCKCCANSAILGSPNRKAVIRAYHKRRRFRPELRAQIWVENTRRRDRRAGRPFDLTVAVVGQLFARGCVYCGVSDIMEMSLDRIDNSLGHTADNVVPCCIRCQMIRGSMPLVAFEHLVPGICRAANCGAFGAWTGRTVNVTSPPPYQQPTYERPDAPAIRVYYAETRSPKLVMAKFGIKSKGTVYRIVRGKS